jgi:phosphate transport system protein
MSKHLQRDIDDLKKRLLGIASMVEEATNKAVVSLVSRRPELARDVMEEDHAIDQSEVQAEEECLKLLALHQPVAGDLRFLVTVLKVNNDLERIGDLAVNIAERAAYLCSHEPLGVSLDLESTAEKVQEMVRMSLDALTSGDASLARRVLTMDDEIDAANRNAYIVLQRHMHEKPESIERAVHLLSASRHLERIADLATNIAEDVVYMVEGELIRHQTENYSGDS